MRNRLRKLLEAHRYESSMGLGQRGLQPHHIDALMKDLAPFIEQEVSSAYTEGRSSGNSEHSMETMGWFGRDGDGR